MLCGECGKKAVRPLAVPGRTLPWKQFPALPLSAHIEIPTCANCGVEWINRKTAESIDADLAASATKVLSAAAREAIDVLTGTFSQQDLEEELGLSAGYLSKLKHGKESPRAPLVALLALLAARPSRLNEIKHVWATGRMPPRVTSDYFTPYTAQVDEVEPAAVAS